MYRGGKSPDNHRKPTTATHVFQYLFFSPKSEFFFGDETPPYLHDNTQSKNNWASEKKKNGIQAQSKRGGG